MLLHNTPRLLAWRFKNREWSERMHQNINDSGNTQLPRPSRVLLAPKQLPQQHPGLTIGGVRWDLFNRKTNGLEASGAVIKRGNRLLIDAEKYLAWLISRGQTEGAR